MTRSLGKTFEIESKLTLDKEGFDTLLSNCLASISGDHLNIYYDSNAKLQKAGAACRIRVFSGIVPPVFTLKIPVEQDGATHTSEELELPAAEAITGFSKFQRSIDSSTMSCLVGEALTPFQISRLNRVGCMRNTRRIMTLPSGGVFELDRFTLPGGEVCFEAEVENSDQQSREWIVASILELAPTAYSSPNSKFQRFTTALKKCQA